MRRFPRRARRAPVGLAQQLRDAVRSARLGTEDRVLDLLDAEAREQRRLRPARTVSVIAAALAAMAGLMGLVAQNALALGIQASAQPHHIYANSVHGENTAIIMDGQPVHGSTAAATQIGFKSATLHGFCLLAPQSIAGIGMVTMRLTAGEPVNGTVDPQGPLIQASNLFAATNTITGNADELNRLTIGLSADTVAAQAGLDPAQNFAGPPGGFGVAADSLDISTFGAEAYLLDLRGSINLPGLRIDLLPGTHTEMADCT